MRVGVATDECIFAAPGRRCSRGRLKSVTLASGEVVTACSGHAGRVLNPRHRDELERVLGRSSLPDTPGRLLTRVEDIFRQTFARKTR